MLAAYRLLVTLSSMERTIGQTVVKIERGDITTMPVDAIVNAANNHLWMGGGVAGAIKRVGGAEIERQAVEKGPIEPGEAVVTGAGRLRCRYVIHAATMGQDLVTSADLIRRATRSSLRRANDVQVASIAFPALGTGVGGFDPVGETFVVAPERERSATGHAITLHKPLRAHSVAIPGSAARAWATNGTPADCVALGILELLPAKPEVVLSGINVGPNVARDLTYSGTVSGAMEGAIFGVPSIAVSVGSFRTPTFSVAAAF